MKEQRYVDLLMDCGFKAVFGDERNKGVVIGFLNAVLAGEHRVVGFEYKNNEHLTEPMTGRGVRFDLHCVDDAGVRFVVEMQRVRHSDDFFERSIYYGSRLYSLQQSKGAASYKMPPVYVIGIMEGSLSHKELGSNCLSRYSMREIDSHDAVPKTISCIFVQLGFFHKTEDECHDILDQWCYVLKNMGGLEEPPKAFRTSAFDTLFQASEIAQFDEQKRIRYDSDMMTERDYQHDLYYSHVEGMQQGMQQGLAEGKAEATSEIARNMKSLGISPDIISKATGISAEAIDSL